MNDTETYALEVRALAKSFGEGPGLVEALRGIDMAVSGGEFVAIMGPSGSGKSTLLHLLAGLDSPDGGRVCVAGRGLDDMSDDEVTCLRRREIGLVFQAFNLLQVLTAEENVALPMIIDGMGESKAHSCARLALERVGIAERAAHYPGQMSGGEQQRVAVARALAAEPVIVLADEPTGNLDSVAGNQIIELLRRLVDDHDQTILMVTHDPGHAAVADRVVRLRDGRVEDEQRMPPGRPTNELLHDLESKP